MAASRSPLPSSAQLRARFDEPSALTVGLEEEVMVLDGVTLDLVPVGHELAAEAGSALVKPELVASQAEIATPPCADVAEAVAHLAEGRRRLADAAAARGLRLAAAAVHPFAASEGQLTPGERYERIAAEYAFSARRQLCAALQVHVAVRPAQRAIEVHDALRSHLPEIVALSACGPYYAGVDTGLASARPQICRQLPRQGVPPALGSFDRYAEALAWARDPSVWWWELRPHPVFGTLEVRVPDVQATLADAAAVAGFVHALVRWLADREALEVHETWRIEENRWSAVRHGVAGTMRDLVTGEPEPTAQRLGRLMDAVEAATAVDLAPARALLADGGPAARLRAAAGGDVQAATRHLADRFCDGLSG